MISHYTAIEDPIDECKEGTHTCDPHADCVDIQNGFLCECREGYQGDGFECIGITLKLNGHIYFVIPCDRFHCDLHVFVVIVADVDECVLGIHNCDRTKLCHYAYSTSGKLECIHIASCNNTLGGYTCHCNTGFTGDGTTCKGKMIYLKSSDV